MAAVLTLAVTLPGDPAQALPAQEPAPRAESPFEPERQPLAQVRDAGAQQQRSPSSPVTRRSVPLVAGSAWSWYMDPRVVETSDATFVAAIHRRGEVTVTRVSHGDASVQHTVLERNFPVDDHNSPALMVLPDGRVLAMWSGHNRVPLRYRVTRRPGDLTSFGPLTLLSGSGLESVGASYAHVLHQPSHPQPYVALTRRQSDQTWVLSRSADLVRWTPAVALVSHPYTEHLHWPYVKFASDGDAIHVLATDRAPDKGSNKLYHFVIRGNRVERTDGTLVTTWSELVAGRPVDLTKTSLVYDGRSADGPARVYDIAIESGSPRIAVTTLLGTDNAFKWAAPDAAGRWQLRTLARQTAYPRGHTLDSGTPSRAFIAQTIGGGVRIVELQTFDGGESWTAMEVDSPTSARTPTTPYGTGGPFRALWLGGPYTDLNRFDTTVWGQTTGPAPITLTPSWSPGWDDGASFVIRANQGVGGPPADGVTLRVRTTLPGATSSTTTTATTDASGQVSVVLPDLPKGSTARVVAPLSERWGYASSGSVTAGVDRVFGADRFETAVRLSQRSFPEGARTVVIAQGEDFPDALSGSALAAHLGGPMLITRSGSLPPAVRAELTRLKPGRIVVLGASSAVSDRVVSSLRQLAPRVDRIGGADRYATSVLVARAFPSGRRVTMASGARFPDALSGGALAGSQGGPLVLTRPDGLPPVVSQHLRQQSPAGITLLGGLASVGSPVEKRLREIAPTRRVGGLDRYDTSGRIASLFSAPTSSYLASGAAFPDALAGGVAAGRTKAPLLLTRPTALPSTVRQRLLSMTERTGTVIGGPAAVDESVRRAYGQTLP